MCWAGFCFPPCTTTTRYLRTNVCGDENLLVRPPVGTNERRHSMKLIRWIACKRVIYFPGISLTKEKQRKNKLSYLIEIGWLTYRRHRTRSRTRYVHLLRLRPILAHQFSVSSLVELLFERIFLCFSILFLLFWIIWK